MNIIIGLSLVSLGAFLGVVIMCMFITGSDTGLDRKNKNYADDSWDVNINDGIWNNDIKDIRFFRLESNHASQITASRLKNILKEIDETIKVCEIRYKK